MDLPLIPTPIHLISSLHSRAPVSCSIQAAFLYCGGFYPRDTCSRAQAVMGWGWGEPVLRACSLKAPVGVVCHIGSSPLQKHVHVDSLPGSKHLPQ